MRERERERERERDVRVCEHLFQRYRWLHVYLCQVNTDAGESTRERESMRESERE